MFSRAVYQFEITSYFVAFVTAFNKRSFAATAIDRGLLFHFRGTGKEEKTEGERESRQIDKKKTDSTVSNDNIEKTKTHVSCTFSRAGAGAVGNIT